MNTMNKKGQVRNILIGLGILIGVIIMVISITTQRDEVKTRPLGTAQTSILKAANTMQKNLLFIDEAARQAAETSVQIFDSQGGMQQDNEDQDYPCGELLGRPYWNTNASLCFDDMNYQFERIFEQELSRRLINHPNLYLPLSYQFYFDQEEQTLELFARSDRDFSIDFVGGGSGFELAEEELFLADYSLAEVPTSLNYQERGNHNIDYVVAHYTVSKTAQGAIDTLRQKGFSYHYLIERDGSVLQVVPEIKSAQHAGCSGNSCLLPGINQKSIGISFVNCGNGESCQGADTQCETVAGYSGCWEVYTEAQLESFVNLVADIVSRNPSLQEGSGFGADKLLMHSEISTEKQDAGPLIQEQEGSLIQEIQERLSRIGSEVTDSGEEGGSDNGITGAVVSNFITGNFVREPSEQAQGNVVAYEEYILREAERNNLDPAIIKAIITQESSGVAETEGAGNDLGLMQIVPFTAEGTMNNHQFCVDNCGFTPATSMAEVKKSEYFNPEKNICCGSAFFKKVSQGSEVQFDCEDVHETYTMPYEIGLRRYNGLGCLPSTKHYVNEVLGYYEFYGGNPAQFRLEEDGEFTGSYVMPASFEQSININLEHKQAIASFAEQVLLECQDGSDNCVETMIETYQQTHNTSNITQDCEEDKILKDFALGYADCLDAGINTFCALNITDNFSSSFSIVLDQLGMGKIESQSGLNSRQALKGNFGHYQDGTETKAGSIKLRFRMDGDTPTYSISINNREVREWNELEYTYFNFLHNGSHLIFLPERNERRDAPPRTNYLLCEHDEEGEQGLTFALKLIDRPPEAVNYYANYNHSTSMYQVQWEPLTEYSDGNPAEDIYSYYLYCDNSPMTVLNPMTLVTIFTENNGEAFDPEWYEQVGPITFPVEACGAAELDSPELYFVVVAVDGQGQYINDLSGMVSARIDEHEELPHPWNGMPPTMEWDSELFANQMPQNI